jgi:uncharacterized protein YraI
MVFYAKGRLMPARLTRMLFFLALTALLTAVPLWAQSRLFDGASLLGRLAPEAPAAQYPFDASAGDRIQVRALGLSGLNPALTVLGPDGAVLAANADDPWALDAGDSHVSFSAPQAGAYTVQVEAEADTSGEFLLQFDQTPAGATALLPAGQTAALPVAAGEAPLRLQFAASEDCATVLSAQPRGASVGVLVRVHDETGRLIGQVNVRHAEQRITVAPGGGLHIAEIVAQPGSAEGELALTVTCAADAPACLEAAPPAAVDSQPAGPSGLLLVQQGGALDENRALQGEVGEASPLVGYTFEGRAGEAILLHVTGISLDFAPKLTLISPALDTLAEAAGGPAHFRPDDAVLRLTLPDDGRYSALVGSAAEQAGAFLVRLLQSETAEAVPITPDAPLTVDVADAEWRYAFSALESCATTLTVETAQGEPLPVPVIVRTADGALVGQIAPSTIAAASFTVPAGSGDYLAFIPRGGEAQDEGEVTLRVSCQSESAACAPDGDALLISTPTPGEPPFAPTATLATSAGDGPTALVAVSSANVRRGDSTAFGVIRALPAGTEVTLLGISATGSGWFKVRMPQGDEGWMSPQVLTVAGDTSDLPGLIPPQPPPTSAAPTRAPNATAAPGSDSGNSDPNREPPPPSAVCGNGTCEAGETCSSCPGDCGSGGPNPCATYCVCPNVNREVQSCDVCLAQTCPNGTTQPRCFAPAG